MASSLSAFSYPATQDASHCPQKNLDSSFKKTCQLLLDPSTNHSEKIDLLNTYIAKLNFDDKIDLLTSFFDKPAKDLLELFNLLESEPRTLLFSALADSSQDNYEFFDAFVRKILEDTIEIQDKKTLITLLLSSFHPLQVEEIATYASRHFEPALFYPFLCLIENDAVIETFLIPHLKVPSDRLLTAYQQLIEGLTKQINPKNASIPLALLKVQSMTEKLSCTLSKISEHEASSLEKYSAQVKRRLNALKTLFESILNLPGKSSKDPILLTKEQWESIVHSFLNLSEEQDLPKSLVSDFPDDFLCLLTDEMSQRLEIPSKDFVLRHLSTVGIQGIEDLKTLGYSKEKQNTAHILREHLLKACLENQDVTSKELEIEWNRLFYESGDFGEKSKAFLWKFNLLDLPVNTLQTLSKSLIKSYKELETIDESIHTKLRLIDSTEKFSDKKSRESFYLIVEECLLAALYCYYTHDITVILRHYLTQAKDLESLQKIWRTCQHGDTLSDLWKIKSMTTYQDIFHLADLHLERI